MTFTISDCVNEVQNIIELHGLTSFNEISQEKRGPGLTLLEAVHLSIGMHSDDSIYAYWEWKELKRFLSELWRVIDKSASSVSGRTTSGIAMTTDNSTAGKNFELIFDNIEIDKDKKMTNLRRRPDKSFVLDEFGAKKSKSLLPNSGKLSWACLATIGVIATRMDTGFGDLFSSLTDSPRSNQELLEHLDDRCRSLDVFGLETVVKQESLVLRTLGRALIATNKDRDKDDQTRLSISEFLIETDQIANWGGLSDHSVLRRLLAIAPEKARAQQIAIDKFLED